MWHIRRHKSASALGLALFAQGDPPENEADSKPALHGSCSHIGRVMSLQVMAGESWLGVLMYAPPKTLADLSSGGRFEMVHDETLPAFAVLKRASVDMQRLLFRVKGEDAAVSMYAFVNEVPDLKFDQVATVELVLRPA